jgi:transcriptional regulator with XRE-family HTH domain
MIMFTAETIKELRTTLRLTMRELGETCGVTVGTVSLWESGKRHPRWQAMQKLNELAEKRKRVRR